ncbi:MAG: DUF2029 domain-containing protein [Solirubrobacterales bacterium]|nr:DUF2029 domain-containing protein [Solirubrobacterales bacterium]
MRELFDSLRPSLRLAPASASATADLPIGVAAPTLRAPTQVRIGPVTARVALAVVVIATFLVVATAAADPSVLVPASAETFPNWEAGPLHDISVRLVTSPHIVGLVFSVLLVAMTIAWMLVIASVRTFSMRTIAIVVVALHAILLLSPPLQLTDLFNYVGYARLGALHHLNPYAHVIRQEMFDPVYRFTSWHSLRSPYGPLFTAFTYPLGLVSLPVAFWTLKSVTVALSLGFLALVWECARRLGRDPRFPLAFTALNPIFLIYAVAGFHNDFFMLTASMGAIALVLHRRGGWAGVLLVVAIAVKFTAVLLLPFLLLAARDRRRQVRLIVGVVLGAIPLAALSLALFGLSIPNLQQQSSLLTDFSIPNVVGLLLHLGGGTPWLLRIATVAVVLVVAHQFWRRQWCNGAGWSTLALIGSLAWLVPWYVVWLLPLAGLGTSLRLRRISIALTVFLLASFLPVTAQYMAAHNVNPLNTAAGQASMSLQDRLAH